MSFNSGPLSRASFTVSLLLLVLPLAAEAQFAFTTNGGVLSVARYTGSASEVVIPASTNGLPIVAVQDFAFSNDTNLTSVVTVDGLKSIGNYVFGYCSSLTNIAIASTVTNIGRGAFYRCENLNIIVIPSGVINVGPAAFAGCFSLLAITVDASNTVYRTVNGVMFNKNLTVLTEYPNGLPGPYTIPFGVTAVGMQAFYLCTNLSEIIFPESLTNIDYAAFFQCSSLTNLALPGSLKTLGNYAFELCGGLPGIVLQEGLLSIGAGAFSQCSALRSVTIPKTVLSIGIEAFLDCPSLNSILVDPLNPAFSSLDGVLFNQSGTTLLQYPGGPRPAYVIPASVTRIGTEAFYANDNLTTVIIPENVSQIEDSAFSSCFNLTNVVFGSAVSSIASHAFYNCPSLEAIYFKGPPPTLGDYVFAYEYDATCYYLPGMAGWTGTFGGLATEFWVLPNPLILTGSPGLEARSSGFSFTVSWATNGSVIIEASTNPIKGPWSSMSTGILSGGTSYFTDVEWTNFTARFYRVRSL